MKQAPGCCWIRFTVFNSDLRDSQTLLFLPLKFHKGLVYTDQNLTTLLSQSMNQLTVADLLCRMWSEDEE